jgi:hypothetical protein
MHRSATANARRFRLLNHGDIDAKISHNAQRTLAEGEFARHA